MFIVIEGTPYNCSVQYCQTCDSNISVYRACHTKLFTFPILVWNFAFYFVSAQVTLIYL